MRRRCKPLAEPDMQGGMLTASPPVTAILMVDTDASAAQALGLAHSLSVPSTTASDGSRDQAISSVALTAWLNARYAQRHGYAFQYLQLQEPGCAHPRWGWRHPSYCKLPALAYMLQRYKRVAFIDSDSFFAPRAPALSNIAVSDGNFDVFFASDRPFTPGPNCG